MSKKQKTQKRKTGIEKGFIRVIENFQSQIDFLKSLIPRIENGELDPDRSELKLKWEASRKFHKDAIKNLQSDEKMKKLFGPESAELDFGEENEEFNEQKEIEKFRKSELNLTYDSIEYLERLRDGVKQSLENLRKGRKEAEDAKGD